MYRFNGLDSLMTSKGITDNVAFDAYLKEVFSKRESQDANLTGFVWDTPQLDFTYKSLQAMKTIDVMASYVAYNSPALPSGHKTEITTIEGTIPRMKYSVVRGENDYRKQLLALNEILAVARFSNRNETTALSGFVSKQLFYAIDEIVTSFKESLNYQVGRMKSEAKLELDDTSNPRGTIRTTITAQVPEENFMDKAWWQKNADGTLVAVEGSNPIIDIRDFHRELRWKANGYQNITDELSEKYIYKLLSHPAVLREIGYFTSGLALRYTPSNDKNAIAVAGGMHLEDQKDAFRRLIECDELITSKTQCGVERLNPETKEYERMLLDAFAPESYLIRPSGIVGVIKNVVPLRPDGQAIVGGVYGGKGVIEYTYDRDTRTQRWNGELTALAVPTRPQDMYYMKGVEESAGSTEKP